MANDIIRVFIVDDDEDDIYLTRCLIESIQNESYRVHSALDRESALDHIRRHSVDLVLADYRLGVGTGIDLMTDLKAAGCNAPVIILTSHDDEAIDRRANEAGAADFLLKSEIDAKQLHRSMRYALTHAKTLAQLKDSEERYAIAMGGANDGLWDWNLRTNEIYFSPRWKSILGYEEKAIGNDPDEWFRRIHRDDRHRVRQEISAHFEGLTPHYVNEHRMLHANGGDRWVLSRGRAVCDANGTVTRLAGSMTDITERREAEEQLISNVSHELRTPLTCIYQFLTIIADGLAGEVSEQQREYLGIALRNANLLKAMISDLMETTRANTGKLTIEQRRIDFESVVGDVIRSQSALADSVGVSIEYELAPTLPTLFIDAERVRQVLTNLLDNALKYTPEQGLIRIEAMPCPDKSDFVEVVVSDTGCGISPEGTQLIFERLYQETVHQEITRKGLGLGLFISKELVRRHGGQIWVESRLNKGSHFHFTLPAFSLSRMLAPLIARDDEPREELSLISVEISPSKGSTHGSVGIKGVRRVIERCLLPETDLLLPRVDSADGTHYYFVVACTAASGAKVIARRIRDQLEHWRHPEGHDHEYVVEACEAKSHPHDSRQSVESWVSSVSDWASRAMLARVAERNREYACG